MKKYANTILLLIIIIIMYIYYIMYKIHTTKDFSHVVFRHCSPGVSAPRFEAAAPRWAISETGPLPEGNSIQQIYVGNMLITVNMLDVYFALSIYSYRWYDFFLYTWLIHLCIYIYYIYNLTYIGMFIHRIDEGMWEFWQFGHRDGARCTDSVGTFWSFLRNQQADSCWRFTIDLHRSH